jgi:predicted DNA-binding protein (MmcQ/YjbR family)
MGVESTRKLLLSLPHVVETLQWGEHLVFWVGDKAVGGKMFALINLENDGKRVMSIAAGPERYTALLEREGFFPAPYMAHIYWIAMERWDAARPAELEELLRHAHALVHSKLPPKTLKALALKPAALNALIRRNRAALKVKAAAKKKR